MATGYDERSDLYYTHITHHFHCKASPHIQLLDHDNLQKFMLCTYHDKATPYNHPWDHKFHGSLQIFLSFAQHNHACLERENLMAEIYGKGIDLYCRDKTHHY